MTFLWPSRTCKLDYASCIESRARYFHRLGGDHMLRSAQDRSDHSTLSLAQRAVAHTARTNSVGPQHWRIRKPSEANTGLAVFSPLVRDARTSETLATWLVGVEHLLESLNACTRSDHLSVRWASHGQRIGPADDVRLWL